MLKLAQRDAGVGRAVGGDERRRKEDEGKSEIDNGVISQARGAAKVDVRQPVIQSLLSSPRSARHFSSSAILFSKKGPRPRAPPRRCSDRFPLSRTLAPRTASVFIARPLCADVSESRERERERRSKKERLKMRRDERWGGPKESQRLRGARVGPIRLSRGLPPAFNQRLC